MHKCRWTYATAKMVAEIDEKIGICMITGLVTPTASRAIIADNHTWLTGAGLPAQMAVYRDASMLVDEHELMSSAMTAMAHSAGILRPTAIVVDSTHLELFQRYGWLAAHHGFSRAAFTEIAAAIEWAKRQAEVFEQWPAMRLPASAGSCDTGTSFVPARPATDRG